MIQHGGPLLPELTATTTKTAKKCCPAAHLFQRNRVKHSKRKLEELELFIDDCFYNLTRMAEKPEKKRLRTRDSSTDTEDLDTDSKVEVGVLQSINTKLLRMETQLSLIDVLHKDIRDLKTSLEFSFEQIKDLQHDTNNMKFTVNSLTTELDKINKENKTLRETLLDVQCRSMRDNLIFTGIPEKTEEDPEKTVKNFMCEHLKISENTVNEISFHRVHRIGRKLNAYPRPIVAKFERYKQKELVRSRGRELKDTKFGLSDQFPKEIQERRKVLFQIRKEYRKKGIRAIVSVDRLYLDGKLYRDSEVTPWLF